MKTTTIPLEKITRSWHLVDASSDTIGRVCSKIAALLMGKQNTSFSTNHDHRDYVVVINSNLVKSTGKKLKEKLYHHYSNYPGGLKSASLAELIQKDSRRVIESGVYGMLPKNKLRDLRMKRLKVFTSSEHPYSEKLAK